MKSNASGTKRNSPDEPARDDVLPNSEALKKLEELRKEAIDDKSSDEQDEP